MPQITLPITVTFNVTFDYEPVKVNGEVGLEEWAADADIFDIEGFTDGDTSALWSLTPKFAETLIDEAQEDLDTAARELMNGGR